MDLSGGGADWIREVPLHMVMPMDRPITMVLDEWLWIALCLFLLSKWTWRMDALEDEERRNWKRAFLATLIVGAVMIYGIAYPSYWLSLPAHLRPWFMR